MPSACGRKSIQFIIYSEKNVISQNYKHVSSKIFYFDCVSPKTIVLLFSSWDLPPILSFPCSVQAYFPQNWNTLFSPQRAGFLASGESPQTWPFLAVKVYHLFPKIQKIPKLWGTKNCLL